MRLTSGNHAVTVTDLNTGCAKTSANVSITINVIPAANAGADVVVCAGSSVQIGVPVTPTLSNTTSPVCEGASVTLTTTTVGASSMNWYKNGVLLYNKPNTYSDKLNVEIKNSTKNRGILTLYNVLGQNIWHKNVDIMQGSVVETIDLSEIAIGVYSLIFQAEDVEKVLKVVKE